MSKGCTCSARRRAWQDDGTCATCGHRVLESQIEPVVLQVLCGGTGLALWRNAAGFDQIRKVKYGLAPGSADYVGCYRGRYVEVELKTPVGRLSAVQCARRELVGKLGGIYAVVRSVEDANELLRQLAANDNRRASADAINAVGALAPAPQEGASDDER